MRYRLELTECEARMLYQKLQSQLYSCTEPELVGAYGNKRNVKAIDRVYQKLVKLRRVRDFIKPV